MNRRLDLDDMRPWTLRDVARLIIVIALSWLAVLGLVWLLS